MNKYESETFTIENGGYCARCGRKFVKTHGGKVHCRDCHKRFVDKTYVVTPFDTEIEEQLRSKSND